MIHRSHCVVVAEIGINHEGSFKTCAEMVAQAAWAGADAIKLQTVDADISYDKSSPSYALFKRSALTPEETAQIFHQSRMLGMAAFTTAVDPVTIDWVDKLGPDAHKVSSGLLTTTPIVHYLASKGRPLIMSTGMSTEDDIQDAMEVARAGGATDITLLHCTSLYPAAPEQLNLSSIPWLANQWNVRSGFSDHSLGDDAAMLAVTYGAAMVEKHFTLDVTRPDFDHHLSLNPIAFKEMVRKIRLAEKMVGVPGRAMSNAELEMRRWAHRVLVVTRDIDAHTALTDSDVTYRRPAKNVAPGGLPPKEFARVIGCHVSRPLTAGTVLRPEHLVGWK